MCIIYELRRMFRPRIIKSWETFHIKHDFASNTLQSPDQPGIERRVLDFRIWKGHEVSDMGNTFFGEEFSDEDIPAVGLFLSCFVGWRGLKVTPLVLIKEPYEN